MKALQELRQIYERSGQIQYLRYNAPPLSPN